MVGNSVTRDCVFVFAMGGGLELNGGGDSTIDVPVDTEEEDGVDAGVGVTVTVDCMISVAVAVDMIVVDGGGGCGVDVELSNVLVEEVAGTTSDVAGGDEEVVAPSPRTAGIAYPDHRPKSVTQSVSAFSTTWQTVLNGQQKPLLQSIGARKGQLSSSSSSSLLTTLGVSDVPKIMLMVHAHMPGFVESNCSGL